MKAFMDQDFLLEYETAKQLFHGVAEQMPICDYHCHLSPKEILENRAPKDLAQLWLSGDHYKWRAMRACGFQEDYCTGSKPGAEKFSAFAKTLEMAIGNPLYHWAHLELQRYFGIHVPLNSDSAPAIWAETKLQMTRQDFRPQTLIRRSNVQLLCTTDDPADALEYHRQLEADAAFPVRVLPGFRPDRALYLCHPGFSDYLKQLERASGILIHSPDDLIAALEQRADFFHAAGCRVADHSFAYVPSALADDDTINQNFQSALDGMTLTQEEIDAYQTKIMLALGKKYAALGWAMELHIGAMRNNNSRMFTLLGPDAGYDSMGDAQVAYPLSRFLDALEQENSLPKTVLFNLHAKDNPVLAAMAGNFQSAPLAGKIQFGPAWWFLDSIDGMTAQLRQLASVGLLGNFIGMETDSRSFTSYPRHEYFRRLFCNLIGGWVEQGRYENNPTLLAELVQKVCYQNAIQYFNF